MQDTQGKIKSHHLRRGAYLYVRQSTLRQVMENTESTERQYALRQRAVQLGWSLEQLVVLDNDLGQSGSSAADRMGFKKLVADVGLGLAGIVIGLEVSRLARNCTDWHRLLEMCALSDTLILDEDGLYDPSHFNDRLLLGLKGTMSEAELHILKARLHGGILNKAKRGELASQLPVGFEYGPDKKVRLHPDRQVQESLRLFFEMFKRTGSATATVKLFREKGLSFPRCAQSKVNKGQILWGPLLTSQALRTLHNPRYAGAFFFGRTRHRHDANGRKYSQKLPEEEWMSFIPDTHPGYISWEQFQENQKRLLENAQAYGADRRKSPVREGPALLQGIVLCGKCGKQMTVGYRQLKGELVPDYICQREGIEKRENPCQRIPGKHLETAIAKLLIDTVSPLSLEVAICVEEELRRRKDEVEGLRQKHVERLRYEADLARRRFMQVDPNNRLVADELESEWNEKLRAYKDGLEELQNNKKAQEQPLNSEKRAKIMALAKDFPSLWNNPNTPNRERKRMVRLLIEDVTLTRQDDITAQIRFKGGTKHIIKLPLPVNIFELRKTPAGLVDDIDRLLDHYTNQQIADILNQKGIRTVDGGLLNCKSIQYIQRAYGLVSRYERLRKLGMKTIEEVSEELGVCAQTIRRWNKAGFFKSHQFSSRQQYLFEPLGPDSPVMAKLKDHMLKLANQKSQSQVVNQRKDEVQYED